MRCPCRPVRSHTRGFALLTVTVFALVLTIAGMIFFSLSSSETKGALYRQRSSEAFYLADGAIEQARARFLVDRTWWMPPGSPTFTGTAGNGTYDLTVTQLGTGDSVTLLANGLVRNAARRITVNAEVPPTGFDVPLLVGGNLDAGGNLCIEGTVHVNGGGSDGHITCEHVFSHGFTILPPPIYTDPAHFPGSTYYYVKGTKIGSVYQAKIFDGNGNDITAGVTMTDVISYNNGSNTFTYSFTSGTLLTKYFTGATAKFKRNSGDVAAVVNFGEIPLYGSPASSARTSVNFDGGGTTPINATVIDTRFVGSTLDDRFVPSGWFGGQVTVKQISFEPFYGIALVCYNFGKQGGSNVNIGSDAYPALLYITNDAGIPDKINSNFNLIGSIVCLGNWESTGGPDIHYDDGFIDHLPDYLENEWNGGSGTLKVLTWKEIAAS